VAAQLPPEQAWPAAQTFPQLPQLASSVARSTQRRLQAASLATQLAAHWPTPVQTSPVWQVSPQAPQFDESCKTFAQYGPLAPVHPT
jgi:hypothetical protein